MLKVLHEGGGAAAAEGGTQARDGGAVADPRLDGACKGYFLMGENPAVGSANTRLQRLGMANLEWLVVRDFSLIESATWWQTGTC